MSKRTEQIHDIQMVRVGRLQAELYIAQERLRAAMELAAAIQIASPNATELLRNTLQRGQHIIDEAMERLGAIFREIGVSS